MKRIGILVFLLIMVITLLTFREALLYKVGEFLLVDQPASNKVDVAVTPRITRKVTQCYLDGNCGKIYVVMEDFSDTWKILRSLDWDKIMRQEARVKGIKDTDLVVLKPHLSGVKEYAEYLKKLFSENNVKSSIFFQSYYQTRKFRLYLDHYFADSEVATFVQPLENDYSANFVRWWENTMLDNLFASEYFAMAYYYFNKMLWSPVV